MAAYGTSVVKRLSKVQKTELDKRLLEIARAGQPTSVRGLYYMAMGEGLIRKEVPPSKLNNYMRIQWRILRLRRGSTMPYQWDTDGSRTVYGYARYQDYGEFADYSPASTERTTGPNRLYGSRSKRTRWRAS